MSFAEASQTSVKSVLDSESWDFSKMPPEGAPPGEFEAFLVDQGFPVTTKEEIEARNARDKEQWATFTKQADEHGLFSVTYFPESGELYPLGGLKNPHPQFINHAMKVIDEYNISQGTHYVLTRILKGVGIMYSLAAHLQFEAEDPDRGVMTFESQASFTPPTKSTTADPKPLG